MKQTSIDAYNTIKENGLLSKMRMEVYDCLHAWGDMTGRELNRHLGGVSFHKRLSELQNLGVIETDGERPCDVTGQVSTVWRVNGCLPVRADVDGRPTRKDLLKRIEFLEAENADLREQLREEQLIFNM